jgi:hypothetical protein
MEYVTKNVVSVQAKQFVNTITITGIKWAYWFEIRWRIILSFIFQTFSLEMRFMSVFNLSLHRT